jgi:phage host-nuclease inhibitor protein Gam
MKIFFIVLCVLAVPFFSVPELAEPFFDKLWDQSPMLVLWLVISFFMIKMWMTIQRMEHNFNRKFDSMEAKWERTNDRLLGIDKRQDGHEERSASIEANLDSNHKSMEEKLNVEIRDVKKEIEKLELNLDSNHKSMEEKLNVEIRDVKKEIEKLELNLDSNHKSMEEKLNVEIRDVKKEIEKLELKMEEKFDKIDEKFDKVDEKFEKMEARFDARFQKSDDQQAVMLKILLEMKAKSN